MKTMIHGDDALALIGLYGRLASFHISEFHLSKPSPADAS